MNWKRALWRTILALLLIYAIVRTWRRMKPELSRLTMDSFLMWKPAIAPLVLSVLLIMLVNLLHAVLWRRISIDLGSPAPNRRATLHIYFVSGLSKYVVKFGQMAGLAVLAARFGMAAGRATAAALLGNFIFLITGCLFISATIPGIRKSFPQARLPLDPAWIGIILALVIIGGTWLLVGTSFGHRMRDRVLQRARGRFGERLGSAFAMLDEARPRDAAVWITGYAVSWVTLAVAFDYFVFAFYPPAANHLRLVAGVAGASYLSGYLAPTAAGVGARELVMIVLFGLVGMPAPAVLMISILSRLWYMAGELLPLALIPLSGPPLPSNAPPAAVLL